MRFTLFLNAEPKNNKLCAIRIANVNPTRLYFISDENINPRAKNGKKIYLTGSLIMNITLAYVAKILISPQLYTSKSNSLGIDDKYEVFAMFFIELKFLKIFSKYEK